jgi:hypothetical protein
MPSWKKVVVSGSDATLNSLNVTNSVTASSFTGSLLGTATTASYVTFSGVDGLTTFSSSISGRVSTNESAISSLTAATSSYLLNTTDTLAGDLTVTGKLIAQTFETQLVSASIIYESGSTKFGDTLDDVHSFTGSLQVSGSITGSLLGTATTASYVTYANVANKPSLVSGSSQIDHDATTNFVANEHIDHSTVSITAGSGLSGGGDITATRTLSVDSGSMLPYYSSSIFSRVSGDITINSGGTASIAANSVALGTDTTGNYMVNVITGSGISISHTQGEGSTATISHADTSTQASVNNSGRTFIQDITLDDFGHVTAITSATDADTFVGTVTSVAAGSGLNGGTITTTGTISVDSGSMLPYYSSSIFSRVSGDITINSGGTASIAANSVALGTDTTGSYVGTITAGTGIDTTGATTGEDIAHTISVDVSDFMSNGADNRIVTATGSDAMNAEANLTFDGNILAVNTDNLYVSGSRVGIGTTTPATALDVNGDVTITDKIIHSGDTNTAIRFPAADTVTVETAGVEQMRVDSSGNVGFGVIPDTTVHIGRTNANTTLRISRDRLNSTITDQPFGNIQGSIKSTLYESGEDIVGYLIRGIAEGAFSDGVSYPTGLAFETITSGQTSITEKLRITSAGLVGIGTTSPANPLTVNGIVSPSTDNTRTLGTAGLRWSEVFAGNGTINTSDATEKQDIAELNEAEQEVATALKGLIKKYRWIEAIERKGEDARIHVGVMAQDVAQAFEDAGLDAERYGVFCKDVWYTKEETYTEQVTNPDFDEEAEEGEDNPLMIDGEEQTRTVSCEADDTDATEHIRYGVRYDQLWAFIISAL